MGLKNTAARQLKMEFTKARKMHKKFGPGKLRVGKVWVHNIFIALLNTPIKVLVIAYMTSRGPRALCNEGCLLLVQLLKCLPLQRELTILPCETVPGILLDAGQHGADHQLLPLHWVKLQFFLEHQQGYHHPGLQEGSN